ncbi:MAG: iron ABC transporter permease [Actinobacteria bacterium]|nr:iron ABC transporter permease [Actinomycetota bacterium]
MAIPLAYILLRVAESDAGTWDLILRDRTVWLALRSIGLVAAVTAGAIGLGVPLAWLTVRTDMPLRKVWAVLVALPLVIPSYVGAFALISAFGPSGMLNRVTGIEGLPTIGGFAGSFAALTLFTYPYVYLIVAAGVRGLDPSLEEAARGLGRSRLSTFTGVTIPLLRPFIASGGLLVALYTLHDFGAVSLMRFPVFTQAIYLQYRGAFDRTPAAVLSLMLVCLALVILVMEVRARGRARYHRVGSGTAKIAGRIHLGPWRWAAFAACLLITLIAFVGPVATIAFWLARGAARGGEVRLTWAAAGASMGISALGASVALVAALPIALLTARYGSKAASFARYVSYSGYALPGIVVALGFVFFASNYASWIYQSIPLVVLAYVVLFLPQASEPLQSSLLQVGPRIAEAGRALGSGRRRVFVRLEAPLISRGALAAWALVFLTAMKELPATLLLRPTGFETLATRIWTGATAGLYSKAAGPALILLAICAIPLYVLARRVEARDLEVRVEK